MELYKNMIGKQYNNWTVLDYSHFNERSFFDKTRNKRRYAKEHFLKVECKCGTIRNVRPAPLKNGKSKGCGCDGNYTETQFKKKHGLTNSRLYKIYSGMKSRCYKDWDKDYKNYGDRGIAVCNDWLKDFSNFHKWALKNGYKEDLTIDRIDNNGNYSPENCRWTTIINQSNNKRNNIYITYQNKTKTATEWSRELKVNADTLHNRKRLGWSDDEIISTPIGGRR